MRKHFVEASIPARAGRTVGRGASGDVVLYFLSSEPYKIALRSLAGGRPAGCLTHPRMTLDGEGNANEFHTEHKGCLDRARR